MLKKAVIRKLSKPLYELIYHPELRESFGGPMNGQEARRRLVAELLKGFAFDAIVETGTYRGTTTEWLRRISGRPVYSAELDKHLCRYCRLRFLFESGIRIYNGDSRRLLLALSRDRRLRRARLLAYLDAHWNPDLPLADEIDLIFSHWSESVVVVDDFEVPGDPGYGFDAYESGLRLDFSYLAGHVRTGLAVFSPATPSNAESGSKRGCVVLAADAAVAGRLNGIGLLRSATLGPRLQ